VSITLEQLDDDGKENDITILIGKTSLLKFTPGDSIFFSDKTLQNMIKTPDLLCSDLLVSLMEEKRFSEEISKKLSDAVSFQEAVISVVDDPSVRLGMKENLKKRKDEIVDVGSRIKNIESKEKFYLAKSFPLFFCQECNSYLANSVDLLPGTCKFCNTKVGEISLC
jgi:hypothetical protein